MEELTKRAIRYSNQTRLLPHFIFSGDLSERDNQRYSYADVLGAEGVPPRIGANQTGVTSFSTGHERSTWYYVLETRWSPTDAALAYYVTKTSVNDTIRARCQKIRVTQKLFEILDSAYWQLLAHQECLPLSENLVSLRSGIRHKMGQLLDERLIRTEYYQRTEQKVIRARRLLSKIRNEIENDRNVLGSTMALSPDHSVDGGFEVIGSLSKPQFDAPMSDMEMTAVRSRPEAYDAGLAHLSSVEDVKRTIVKYFPKVTGYWRFSRDKDRFLYNKDWKDIGLSVYFDLGEWLANLDESKAAQIKAGKTQREMGAVALGIMSQVRVAAIKYLDGLDELDSAESSVTSFGKILRSAKTRQSMDDLEKIAVEEANADVLEAKINRLRALGEANAELAALQSAMGTNYTELMSH